MAHETLIHRIDAEQAHGYQSAVDPGLAVDGVDEMLEVVLAPFPDGGEFAADDTAALIRTADRSWLIRPGEYTTKGDKVVVRLRAVVIADGEPGVTIGGEPEHVLLWLWGRGPADRLVIEGDHRLARRVREVCSI